MPLIKTTRPPKRTNSAPGGRPTVWVPVVKHMCVDGKCRNSVLKTAHGSLIPHLLKISVYFHPRI
jgi:hypothetical protein